MPLRVLATGFAPGFVYCGLHPDDLSVPRREAIRPMVPAGTVLFAAGQTAIAATDLYRLARSSAKLHSGISIRQPIRRPPSRPVIWCSSGCVVTTITILRAGPLTTLQDAGRFGMLRHGISASGPMDRGAFAAAGSALERAGSW